MKEKEVAKKWTADGRCVAECENALLSARMRGQGVHFEVLNEHFASLLGPLPL